VKSIYASLGPRASSNSMSIILVIGLNFSNETLISVIKPWIIKVLEGHMALFVGLASFYMWIKVGLYLY